MFGKNHTDEAREIMSRKRVEMIISGKVKAYGKNRIAGEYKSSKTDKKMSYRSSWELAVMKFLDENDDVLSYEYEGVRIPYYYKTKKRWHVPDFLIKFSDGSKQMWEVKPAVFIESEKVQEKAKGARKFCEELGSIEYRFITEHDLREMKVVIS
tara:strand:- start:372 stop:833 length:462 start_codon:yes stop_codon:yes gene_type:complete